MQDITNRILRQMNSTRLISTLFKPRQKATALYATQAEALQHKVFCRLMKDAAHTEWGLKYGYKDIKRYQDFQRVPIQTYEEIKPYVERMRHGEKDVLWRGEVQWFAKSSGTTNDKSKRHCRESSTENVSKTRSIRRQRRVHQNDENLSQNRPNVA